MLPPLPPRCFTVQYNGRANVLKTDVEVSIAFDLPRVAKRNEKPPPLKHFIAIWDTGATNSAITRKVVDELDLKPIGIVELNTAGGTKRSPVYLVCIALPNKVAFADVRVTEADLVGDADVLIGMDMISQGDFAVTNSNGTTTLSFRIPSISRLDFVAETQAPPPQPVQLMTKVGRNDPCPCGSGKKYKHCHMQKT